MEERTEIKVDRTLAIVKPDAARSIDTIRELILQNGFHILQQRRVHLTPEQGAEFYKEHSGKSFYPHLTSYISSAPIVVMLLGRSEAIETWRSLMGPSNPATAKAEAPETLRARFGHNELVNSFHGSESVGGAEREIRFFFPTGMLEPLSIQDSKEYLAKYINPILTAGLAELVKEKPADPLGFLADYLDENNPNMAFLELPSKTRPGSP